jgi:hypothetical protein
MATVVIVEKPKFDVYGMLLVLSFLMTGVAAFLLNDDLSSNWGFKLFGDKDSTKRATHITELHDLTRPTPYVVLRKEDIEDWKAIPEDVRGGKEFPVKNWEWPEGYDVYANPVLPNGDNLSKIKEDQIQKLLSTAEKEAPPEPVARKEEPKETPKETPPTPEPPKDAAPKDATPTPDAATKDAAKETK